MSLIRCEHLSLAYDNKIILDDLNFSIEKGDYLCIVGDNGAGKSSLIKALLKLHNIKKGQIIIDDDLKRQGMGYLAQNFNLAKDFPSSVKEVVLSGTLKKGKLGFFYNRNQKKLAEDNMKKLDIFNLKNKSIQELSSGQLQRVLLARALCVSDRILLLDEPVASLDPKITQDFYRLIKKLNDDGLTIVMVSHDLALSLKDANKVLHLKNQQLFFGLKKDYLKTEDARYFLRGKYEDII